jgi:hypothetical protein
MCLLLDLEAGDEIGDGSGHAFGPSQSFAAIPF